MKLLITAATSLEIRDLMMRLGLPAEASAGKLFRLSKASLDLLVLITGVGSSMMLYHLAEAVNKEEPDLLICAGIAGSFKDFLMPGELVVVTSEMFADVGTLKNNQFQTVWESKLNNPDQFPFEQGVIPCKIPAEMDHLFSFPKVRGITVNSIHSGLAEKSEAIRRYDPEVESMEGAAFAFFCKNKHLKSVQLRAISNFTSEPDSRKWDFPKALKKIDNELTKIVDQLTQR